jgi:Protein of unknown function (DUF1402).
VVRFFLAVVVALMLVAPTSAGAGVVLVPDGNRHAEQPAIPGASVRRTKAGKTTFDLKYEKVRDLLASDRQLIAKIKSTAADNGIDPIHIVSAIVGEHPYHVDADDRLLIYYVKAASYACSNFRFGYEDESVEDFLSRSEFSECNGLSDSYRLRSCRELVWEKTFRGHSVDGISYPNNRFCAVFFQPFYAGQTFGLGQINPLTALMLTDFVAQKSGYPRLNASDAAGVYKAIMDPDISLAFMAAILRKSIDDYRSIAGMDISRNPGVTATLFNVGNSLGRAQALARKNAAGGAAVLPEENYYGWLVNDRLAELKALL